MDNTQTVRRLFELFGRRQLDQAVALFAPDAEFEVPGRNAVSGTYRGRAGVLEFWQRQLDRSGGAFHTQILSLTPTGDEVAVDVEISSELDGEVVRWRRRAIYRLASGLITRATYREADQQLADRVFTR